MPSSTMMSDLAVHPATVDSATEVRRSASTRMVAFGAVWMVGGAVLGVAGLALSGGMVVVGAAALAVAVGLVDFARGVASLRA